jgi:DNA helicase-2/ATP-dependent DNA helicase PcrA
MLHGQIRYNLPSQFLQEIPEPLVRSLSYRTTKSAPAAAVAPPRATPTRAERYQPRPVPRREASLPYKIGARVSHPKYGEGIVGAYQGQGAETEIKVTFPKIGEKWFILEYARLVTV